MNTTVMNLDSLISDINLSSSLVLCDFIWIYSVLGSSNTKMLYRTHAVYNIQQFNQVVLCFIFTEIIK